MCTMESEQFFLKWNNFESNLASGFADLLQTEAMVDVTLAAEGKIVQAHKIILSICSSYFRNMFQVNPCQHPIVVLKDVRFQELTDMLDFMYKGEANVRQQDLPSFLKLAQTLEVKGLAGSQEEIGGNERKRSQSNVTKDISFDLDEPANDVDKDSMYKKKSKRCLSPMLDTRNLNLPQSPNVKQEIEKCDSNFMSNDVDMGAQNVIIKEERLSDNSLDSYGENAVGGESTEMKRIAGPSSIEDNCDAIPQEKVQTTDYSFLESCFGGRLLVFDGYSYRKKSATAERSYWFCCRRKCPAKGVLCPDGKFQFSNLKHNHEPEFEDIKRKEKLIQLKKLALQLNVSGQDLLQALDIKDDIKKHLSFIRTCRRRARKSAPPETPINAGLEYQRLPTRVGSKEMILHSGYLYRQDSKNPVKKNCRYWRCRLKNCKARAKTDEMGNLTILKMTHSHPPEEATKPQRDCSSKKEKLNEETTELRFSPPAPDAETFSLDKLMAETLADCVEPEFADSLLKS